MTNSDYRRVISGDLDTDQRPLTWGELDGPMRRRRVRRAGASVTLRTALLVTAYYLAPFEGSGAGNFVLHLALSILILVAAVSYTLVSVLKADYPIIRAAEGIATLIVVMLLAFASTYSVMSQTEPAAFSEVLDHTGALYFAITTSTTVGFGDISPSTDTARIAVMVQMLVNVLLIGVGIRLLVNTAKRRARST